MTTFSSEDRLEFLTREVEDQFALAVEHQEHKPESVALFVRGKLVGGFTRVARGKSSKTVTAIVDAQHTLEDEFGIAAHHMGSVKTILVKTLIREDGVTPRQPSSSLIRDIKELIRGEQVSLVVLGKDGEEGLTINLNAPTPEKL